jgi:hypothetical protein
MGMTMAEKILARSSSIDSVHPGDILIANVDKLMIVGELFKTQNIWSFFEEYGFKWN